MDHETGIPSLMYKMEPYIDVHLLIMVADFFLENSIGSRKEALEYLIRLVSRTKMVSYEVSLRQQLTGEMDVPPDLAKKQGEVAEMVKQLEESAIPILEVLGSSQFKEMFELYSSDPDTVTEKCVSSFDFPINFVDVILQYAHSAFDSGLYEASANVLSVCCDLLNRKSLKYLVALWGELSCRILVNHLDAADSLLELLKGHLDAFTGLTTARQLNNYAHYMHWCLFVYFKTPELMERIPDLFLRAPMCRLVLQTVCPHLLRYVVVATVLHPNNGEELKSLVELVVQEEHRYSDSFTSCIKALLWDYDIDTGICYLASCDEALSRDFFVAHLRPDFLFCAQLLAVRVYSQTHNVVRAQYISGLLGVDLEMAQRLIGSLFNVGPEQAAEPIHSPLGTNPVYHQIAYRGENLTDRVIQGVLPEIDRKTATTQAKDKRWNRPPLPLSEAT